jgi:hypothetical protein
MAIWQNLENSENIEYPNTVMVGHFTSEFPKEVFEEELPKDVKRAILNNHADIGMWCGDASGPRVIVSDGYIIYQREIFPEGGGDTWFEYTVMKFV